MKTKPTLLLVIVVACAAYLVAFQSAGCIRNIDTFDTIMTQDMAQIARNTQSGHILETKYVVPMAYMRFPTIENHPDYIRYPLPILIYALVFSGAPSSPATLKFLNGILFLFNTTLVYYIALYLFRRKDDWTFPRQWIPALALVCSLGSSVMLLPYLRLVLTDAYEILSVTVLLIAFITTFIRRSPALAGVSAILLYISRSNMIVFAPLMLLFLIVNSKGRKQQVRVTAIFLASGFLVFLPFLLRNLLLTHEPIFSLQQSVELLKGIKGDHSILYRSFAAPPSLLPLSPDQLHALIGKTAQNLKKPILFALKPYYLPAWCGVLLFARFFKKERLQLLTCLAFVVLHVAVCSLFLQLPRVYVPVFYLPIVLGCAGLAAMLGTALRSVPKRVAVGALMAFLLVVVISPIPLQSRLYSKPDTRTQPPSSTAVRILRDRKIACVYANNPFWIPWYADRVAVFAPVNPKQMLKMGPRQCNHYIADKRKAFPSDFLAKNAQLLYEDSSFALYRLTRAR